MITSMHLIMGFSLLAFSRKSSLSSVLAAIAMPPGLSQKASARAKCGFSAFLGCLARDERGRLTTRREKASMMAGGENNGERILHVLPTGGKTAFPSSLPGVAKAQN